MESLFEKLLQNVMGGGPGAIISILILICGIFAWWIWRMDKVIHKKDERLDDVTDKVINGNFAVAESLNQLRSTIFELIKSKL